MGSHELLVIDREPDLAASEPGGQEGSRIDAFRVGGVNR
jgi:hypothetical protein